MNKRPAQDGFVSIIMALVIMIFVTLIALGFAMLARQNLEQNQNRELSTQAFYAAESGVNDAVDYIKKQFNSGVLASSNTNCNQLSLNGYSNAVGSTNNAVKYTCVLYDTTPTNLDYNVDTDHSQVVRVQSSNGPLSSITISWQDSAGSKNFASNPAHGLPQQDFNTTNPTDNNNLFYSTGIVRATIIPGSGLSRTNLTDNAQTLFLYPNAGNGLPTAQNYLPGGASPNSAEQGAFVDGNCNLASAAGKYCNAQINNLTLGDTIYVRLRSLYRGSTIKISGTTNGGPAKFINGQAVIDATGKANDVVRRIQVRVPLSADTQKLYLPEFAIESANSTCKRLMVWAGGSATDPDNPGALVDPVPGFTAQQNRTACGTN